MNKKLTINNVHKLINLINRIIGGISNLDIRETDEVYFISWKVSSKKSLNCRLTIFRAIELDIKTYQPYVRIDLKSQDPIRLPAMSWCMSPHLLDTPFELTRDLVGVMCGIKRLNGFKMKTEYDPNDVVSATILKMIKQS